MTSHPFVHSHRITYAECTVGNHVYFARYLDVLEETRGELFRAAGLPLLELQAADLLFPVVACQIRYRHPARYDDLVTIDAWVSAISPARLRLSYRMRAAAGQAIVDAEIDHVCTSTAEKIKRLPPVVVQKLAPYTLAAASGAPSAAKK